MRKIRTIKRVILAASLIIAINVMLANADNMVKADDNIVSQTQDEQLTVNKSKVVIDVGKKIKLTSNKEVNWTSSNSKIAKISKNGVIKAKKNGIVTVKATSINDKQVIRIRVFCGGYKITKSRFPDKGFREYVKSVYDRNKDGYLSNKERGHFVFYLEGKELTQNKKGKKLYKTVQKIKNLKGIDYFYKLKGIKISGADNLKTIDFSGMDKLVYFSVHGPKLHSIKADGCQELMGFEVSGNALNTVSAMNCRKLGVKQSEDFISSIGTKTGLVVNNYVSVFSAKNFKTLNVTNSSVPDENIMVDKSVNIIK